MADPASRTPESRASQSRSSRPQGRGDSSRGGDSAREAPAESRTFEQSSEAVRRGGEAARELARGGTEAGRRLSEASFRAADRSVDLWRQTMSPLTTFSFEMNRLFDEFWRTVPGMTPGLSGPGIMQGLMGMPCADLHETPDAYHISVELAGMQPGDVEILLDGDTLLVRGEKQDTHREERAGFRVNERRFGRFERRFHMPRDADCEDIQAEFRQGLLEVRVARCGKGEDNRRRIEVTETGGAKSRRESPSSRA